MKPIFTRGRLVTWKEDKGFGFIKAHNDGKDVFLHISVFPDNSRHPRVGDTILYQRTTTPKGKVRAAKASIVETNAKLTPSNNHKSRHCRRILTVASLVVLSTVALIAMEFRASRSPGLITAITRQGCAIKGNISRHTGNKTYHLPDMENYETTIISPGNGEKWFCTETEAIANGWNKASK
ncbi:MAG: cold shock domain-containing protein [Leptolyngbyaceae cyanobacterium MAG.088]|nr:cold shock domain-containing protein [Leptolyngbyaceae cyanobacterium MAG.088]